MRTLPRAPSPGDESGTEVRTRSVDDERLRAAFDAAEVGLWNYDPSTGSLWCDSQCRVILGLSPSVGVDLVTFVACVHPDDRARVAHAIQHALDQSTTLTSEFRVRDDAGLTRWVSMRGGASEEPNSWPSHMAGIVVDRTDSRTIDELVLEQAPIGIGFWDERAQCIRMNTALADSGALAVTKPDEGLLLALSPAEAPRRMSALERVRTTGESTSFEVVGRVTHATDVARHWRVHYYPVHASGVAVGIGVVCADITEQRNTDARLVSAYEQARTAREEAEHLSRLKDEFLLTVSHELRTPLQSILGWSWMLRDSALSERERTHGVETIERNARLQVRIIEDILDVSRIISGKLRIARNPVALAPLVEGALDMIRAAAAAKSIQLTSSYADQTVTILADQDRLKQVLWNLLSNAVKFTPRHGTISLDMRIVDESVDIRVVDSGQGIRTDFLPHVFERFRQQDGGTARNAGGLGLGLAIVRHLVEMHGGTAFAESEGVGRGATFGIRLPLQAPSSRRTRDSESPLLRKTVPPPSHARRRVLDSTSVLVVDDEEDARDLLAIVLRQNGATTTVVGSVEEALEALEERSFDVVVSDIGMPEQDGYTLAIALRDRADRPRVVLALTAYSHETDRIAAIAAGFDAHIAKPIEPEQLVTVIANLLKRQGNWATVP